MHVEAFLCDAATVREQLLHVLGAGLTRLGRPSYPAPMGVDLAMMVTLKQLEAQQPHRLRVVVQDQDGRTVAEVDGEFGVGAAGADPGELLAVPLVMPMKGLPLPRPGVYSVEILVDGQLHKSLAFKAFTNPAPGERQ